MEALFVLSTQSNADVRRLPNGQTFDDTRWVSGEWHHHATKAHHAEPAQQYISKCGIIPYQIEFTSHSPAGKNKLSMRSFPNIMSSLFRPCLLKKKEKRKKKNSRYIIRRRAVVLLIRWCDFERIERAERGESSSLCVCIHKKPRERKQKGKKKRENPSSLRSSSSSRKIYTDRLSSSSSSLSREFFFPITHLGGRRTHFRPPKKQKICLNFVFLFSFLGCCCCSSFRFTTQTL